VATTVCPVGRSQKYEAVIAARFSAVPAPQAPSSFALKDRFALENMNAGATRMAKTTRTPARFTELVTVNENVPKNASSLQRPRSRPRVNASTAPMTA